MDNAITLTNLCKNFPQGKKDLFHAVKNVNVTVEKGQCLGIVGESGCGKSTLAKMVVGTLPPSSGSVVIHGVDIWAQTPKEKQANQRNIQMVYQDPISSFSPRMTIGQYLCEPRINYDKVSKEVALEEAKDLLKGVELPEEFLSRKPHQLSGGQLQRVAIARALAISPEVLICDEATSALDVSIQKQILELLHKLRKERNLTCLFIGHDLAVVQEISDKIIVMYYGEVVEEIASEDLVDHCKHDYTKLLLNSCFDVYADQNQEIIHRNGHTFGEKS